MSRNEVFSSIVFIVAWTAVVAGLYWLAGGNWERGLLAAGAVIFWVVGIVYMSRTDLIFERGT